RRQSPAQRGREQHRARAARLLARVARRTGAGLPHLLPRWDHIVPRGRDHPPRAARVPGSRALRAVLRDVRARYHALNAGGSTWNECAVASGVGVWGEKHARVYGSLKESELVGVYDRSRERAEAVTKQFGGRVFATPEA